MIYTESLEYTTQSGVSYDIDVVLEQYDFNGEPRIEVGDIHVLDIFGNELNIFEDIPEEDREEIQEYVMNKNFLDEDE